MKYEHLRIGTLTDLDYTLYRGSLQEFRDNCWLEYTYQLAILAGYTVEESLVFVQKHGQIYHGMLKAIDAGMDPEQAFEEATKQLFDEVWLVVNESGKRRIHQEEVYQAVREFGYREYASEVYAQLSQLGVVALATGAFDVAAQTAATLHGISGEVYSCSQFIFDEEGYWTGFNHQIDLSSEKLKHAKEFVAKHELEVLIVIGDGDSDRKIFEATAEELGVQRVIKVAVGDALKEFADIVVYDEDWHCIPVYVERLLQNEDDAMIA